MNNDPPGWHRQLKTIVAMIAMIFAVGGWVYVQDWRVQALEDAVKGHTELLIHPKGGERLVEMETHLSYIRRNVEAMTRAVNKLSDKLDKSEERHHKTK